MTTIHSGFFYNAHWSILILIMQVYFSEVISCISFSVKGYLWLLWSQQSLETSLYAENVPELRNCNLEDPQGRDNIVTRSDEVKNDLPRGFPPPNDRAILATLPSSCDTWFQGIA